MNNIKKILSDQEKTIYSARVTVARTEKVDSGSMMFHHPRYITFGQMVVFTDSPVEEDQGGALFFKKSEEEEVLKNIGQYIQHGKEKPENSEIIEEVM